MTSRRNTLVTAYAVDTDGTVRPVRGQWTRHAVPRLRDENWYEHVAFATEREAITFAIAYCERAATIQRATVALYEQLVAEWAEKRAKLEARVKELEKR